MVSLNTWEDVLIPYVKLDFDWAPDGHGLRNIRASAVGVKAVAAESKTPQCRIDCVSNDDLFYIVL